MDVEKLVSVYVKIRDARAKRKEQFEAEDKGLKEQQSKLEAALLKFMQDNNMDSVRTNAGTCSRQVDIMPSVSDWSAFYSWIKENDAFDALERRVKKTFVKDHMDEHENALPPGVSINRAYIVRVRRS